jgi:hypothetical protein
MHVAPHILARSRIFLPLEARAMQAEPLPRAAPRRR